MTMFEDSLIESGGRLKTKRGWTSIVSFTIQIGIIGVMVLIPLIFTEASPKGQMMFLLVAPPPPPPRPRLVGRGIRASGSERSSVLPSAGAPGPYSGRGGVAGPD